MTRVYAEYDDPGALARAIRSARAWGRVRIEAYTPYHVAEIERALDAPPSRLSYAVLAGGLTGAAGAYGLQWLLNAYDYPIDVGGRPPHMPLSYVPITFEMAVLFASFAAIAAVLVGARLLRLWHPSSEVPGIESATGWRFWLEIEPLERAANIDDLVEVIQRTRPLVVHRLEVA
jgi:Protein of unknown function (DUF3341)